MNIKIQDVALLTLCGVLALLLASTHVRNDVWRAPIALWEDVISRQP